MRFLLMLMVGLFFQTVSFAQIDNAELQKELEKMQKEMQEQMKNLDFEQFKFDTLIFKNFQFPEGFDTENFIMPNDVDLNEMMKMLERQMSQLDMEGMIKMMEENLEGIDFSEMEKMMEPFMKGEFFMIPAPEELEKQEKGQPKQNKKKKKRKAYKM